MNILTNESWITLAELEEFTNLKIWGWGSGMFLHLIIRRKTSWGDEFFIRQLYPMKSQSPVSYRYFYHEKSH